MLHSNRRFKTEYVAIYDDAYIHMHWQLLGVADDVTLLLFICYQRLLSANILQHSSIRGSL